LHADAAAAGAQGVPAIDNALAVVAPLHGHIALNFVRARVHSKSVHVRLALTQRASPPHTCLLSRARGAQVISDYVPVSGRPVVRTGVLGLSLVTVAGLLKLNRDGPGVTATLKSLWRK
jgi:succinate dehydrogenase (ubiquinone) membrane anchor subunit